MTSSSTSHRGRILNLSSLQWRTVIPLSSKSEQHFMTDHFALSDEIKAQLRTEQTHLHL